MTMMLTSDSVRWVCGTLAMNSAVAREENRSLATTTGNQVAVDIRAGSVRIVVYISVSILQVTKASSLDRFQ